MVLELGTDGNRLEICRVIGASRRIECCSCGEEI